MGESFELMDQYVVVDYLGSGAYGCVCAALEVLSGKVEVTAPNPPSVAIEEVVPEGEKKPSLVAIKKCKLIFESRTLAKRTLREIRLLRCLSHPNVITLQKVLMPRYAATFNEMYLVFEMMETDLASIVRSQQPLTDNHVRYFSLQLLRACEYLHQNNVVHRDIKPRNILVNGDCSLRLADFGLSRTHSKIGDSRTVAMTEYVTTRWYRAPEILVGWGQYGSGIDMWAVGCVICELIGRIPIFPGSDSKIQLDLIVKVLGRPADSYIRNIRKINCRDALLALPNTSEYARKDIVTVLNELPDLGPWKSISKKVVKGDITPGASRVSPSALRLIDGLLVYDPAERLSASDCLRSSYFHSLPPHLLQNPIPLNPSLSSATAVLNGPEFDFEYRKLNFDDLRCELLREAKFYDDTIPNISIISNSRLEHDILTADSSVPMPSRRHDIMPQAPSSTTEPCHHERSDLPKMQVTSESHTTTTLATSAKHATMVERERECENPQQSLPSMYCGIWNSKSPVQLDDKISIDHSISINTTDPRRRTATQLVQEVSRESQEGFRTCVIS